MWCVAWFDTWFDWDRRGIVMAKKCACKTQPKKHPKKYRDHMRTKCDMVVTFPVGIEFREPTCPECLEKEKLR